MSRELLVAAAKRLKDLSRHEVFNPERPDLQPTDNQLEILKDDKHQVIHVVGGNRCLAKDTLVATSTGPKPIQEVEAGDTVYDETGKPIKVLKTFRNGPKPVVSLVHRGQVKAKSTLNHVWLTRNSSKPGQGIKQKPVEKFVRDTQIKQTYITAPLGNVSCNHYTDWCKGRKAHQKTVDMDVVKSWNRESLLQFVAGVLDTDGSVYQKDGHITTIRVEMQATPVIKALQYAFLALWQIESNIIINDRDKFVNGPTRTIGIYNSIDSKRALKELDTYLVTPSKKYKEEYDSVCSKRTSDGWSGIRIQDDHEIKETYDIHVDSPTNLYCLSNGLVCHNSGKCIVSGTLVATPQGPIAIEDLESGDTVYNEHGQEIKVLNKKYQGVQKILPVYENRVFKVAATANHRWLSTNNKEIYTEDLLYSKVKIKTVELKCPLGNIDQPHAYAIGALLGDGCRSHGRSIVVSSEDNIIPNKIAKDLDAEVKKQKGDNFNWLIHNRSHLGQINTGKEVYCAHYRAWIDNHAHNKIADIDVIKTWNRTSVLKFVAGLLDSDGSVYQPSSKRLSISWGMQAKSVIEVLQYCILALWNYDTNITADNRDKYVNGPVFNLAIGDLRVAKTALKELSEFLQVERKKYKTEYDSLVPNKTSYHKIREDRVREDHTWDIEVDSPTHLFCLANGMVTHNSQLGARTVTWWFNNCHPHQERPKEWGDGPITIIVVGRVGEQIETELFNRKIKPYLVEGTYKLHRPAGSLSRITHKTNGNSISFFSHHNINEAREKLQAFTTHVLWLDEMATSSSFIAELMTRLITTNGKMMCTFTPLVRSEQVKRLVDGATGPATKYKISMLDNPLIAEDPKKLENIMAMYKDLSEAEKRTRLYGDWYLGAQAVYEFDSDSHVEAPQQYHPAVWRHILSIDPAMSGKTGVTIWGEDPRTGIWYCVLADYIQNALHPDDVVEKAERMASPFNICKRISDPHEVWFITTAAKYKYHYTGVFKKNERKDELIKNLQSALSNNQIKITPQCSNLMDEFVGCQWSETAVKKIINSSSYHLLDTAQYFVDNKPKFIHMQPLDNLNSFETKLRAGHKAKVAKENAKKRKLRMKRGRKWKR